MKVTSWAFVLTLLVSLSARAEFSPDNPSVNGTAETLKNNEFELGLTKVSFGLTDNTMIELPSAASLVGYGHAELKHKFELSDQSKISPYIFAKTPRKYGAGLNYGLDFGAQSITLGGRVQLTSRVRGATNGPRSKLHTQLLPNLEYDYYHRGNVVYAGIYDYALYLGYTWAFKRWHLGFITGPRSSFFPLPYVYLRF